MSRAGWIILGVGACLTAPRAQADPLYWIGAKLPNGPTQPFIYWVDETEAPPAGLTLSTIQAETQTAFATWGDAGCSYLGFSFAGAITQVSQLGNSQDDQSAMSRFITSASDPLYDQDLGGGVAIGVALTYEVDGVILGCDTLYNGVDFSFGDRGDPAQMDFPSLALHEAGHCVGLAHQPDDPQSAMYATLLEGQVRRALDADDVSNICQLYPLTGALGSPCASDSCGQGLACIPDPGQGGMICSRPCDLQAAGDCGAGFGCQGAGDAGGLCLPGLSDQVPPIGAPCEQEADCVGTGGVCLTSSQGWPGGYCTAACGAEACPADTICAALNTSISGCLARCSPLAGCRAGYACYPLDGTGDGFCFPSCSSGMACPEGSTCQCSGICATPGNPQGVIGAACTQASDCATGSLCQGGGDGGAGAWMGGYCTAPCGESSGCGACPTGSACIVTGSEGQASCLATCNPGEPPPCRSGYGCIPQGAQNVCLPGCSGDTACPVGTTCVSGSCLEPDQLDGGGCTLCADAGTVGNSSGGPSSLPHDVHPASCGCGNSPGRWEPWVSGMVLAWLLRRPRS